MALTRIPPAALLTDRVFDTIHAAIMRGDLPGGSQLKVRDLAEQVGTSVMPVREAIRRLEESGLAVREPHKGAVVRSLTTTELVQTYEVRILLEAEAARLGAEQVSDGDCTAMLGLCDQLGPAIETGDVVRFVDLDEAILTVLYTAAGNPVLLESIRGLWQRCRGYKIRGTQRARDLSDDVLWSFQPRIVAAAQQRDGELAATVTRESLVSATDRLHATLAAPAGLRAGRGPGCGTGGRWGWW